MAVIFQLEQIFLWISFAKVHPSLFTFSTLLFTFLLFLLPLAKHRCSLCCLLQLGHEVLDVIETVIEDPLRKGEPVCYAVHIRITAGGDWEDSKVMRRRTTSLSARRKETSGPPFTPFAVVEERRGFSSSIFIHGPGLCCIWNSCPLYPWNPPPLHTHSHKAISVLLRAFYL